MKGTVIVMNRCGIIIMMLLPLLMKAQRPCYDQAPSLKSCYPYHPWIEKHIDDDSITRKIVLDRKLKTVTAMVKEASRETGDSLRFFRKKVYDKAGRLVLDSAQGWCKSYAYDDKHRLTAISETNENGKINKRTWSYSKDNYLSRYTSENEKGKLVVKHDPVARTREHITYKPNGTVEKKRIETLDEHRIVTGYMVKDGKGNVLEKYKAKETEQVEELSRYLDEDNKDLRNKTDWRTAQLPGGRRLETIRYYDGHGNPSGFTRQVYDSMDLLLEYEEYDFYAVPRDMELPYPNPPETYLMNDKPSRKIVNTYNKYGELTRTAETNAKGETVETYSTVLDENGNITSSRKLFGKDYIQYYYFYTFF